VSTPGWYPDPAGLPNRLRYWDGGAWTTQVADPGAAGSSGRQDGGNGSKKGWLWAGLAGLAVVALIAGLVLWNPLRNNPIAAPAPTYSPTISAWNESETPTPTPSQPTPSVTQLRCDREAPQRTVGATVAGGRLHVGAMSMPAAPAEWDGPAPLGIVTYGEGAYGYTREVEPTWMNTMLIGPTNFADKTSLETQARTIIACLAGYDVLSRYKAPDTLSLKSLTISGHAAVKADAAYSWNDTDLQTKGSLIRVVVADTSDGPYFFMAEATKERSDMVQVLTTLSAGLAVS
jgi:hypothetical protein